MEVCDIVQKAVIKTIPMEKKCKKAKWLSGEALQIAEKREAKGKGAGKIYPFECRIIRIARRNKNAFLRDQCKEIQESNRIGKTRKLELSREHFMQRWD